MPQFDQFDRMLSEYMTLLPKLRDKFGKSNCPLTAEAVWKYFNTGNVVAARRLLAGFQTVVCEPGRRTDVKRIESASSSKVTARMVWLRSTQKVSTGSTT